MSGAPDFPLDPDERMEAMLNCQYMKKMNIEVVNMDDEEVRLAMDVEGNRNALGTGHGASIFSLADMAFALAANRNGDPEVAITATINFIRPALNRLEAVAKLTEENNSTSFYQVLIYDGEDIVAYFQGVGYKLRRSSR
jgi:acyl-CoA thioesterase